jgi:hypothetical protein
MAITTPSNSSLYLQGRMKQLCLSHVQDPHEIATQQPTTPLMFLLEQLGVELLLDSSIDVR